MVCSCQTQNYRWMLCALNVTIRPCKISFFFKSNGIGVSRLWVSRCRGVAVWGARGGEPWISRPNRNHIPPLHLRTGSSMCSQCEEKFGPRLAMRLTFAL